MPLRGLESRPAPPRATRHCCGSALLRGRHTCTPDVAQEGEPAEPEVGTRPSRPGQGPGSAEENAEPESRCRPLPDSRVGDSLCGPWAVRPAVAFPGKAWQGELRLRGDSCVSDWKKTLGGGVWHQKVGVLLGAGSAARFASALSAASSCGRTTPTPGVGGSGGVC